MKIPGDRRDGADVARQTDWTDALYGRLLQQRTILVAARLDDEAVGDLVAQLMTLDATGDDPISLQFASCAGELGAALAVVDVIDSLGVPVHATASGLLEGPPIAILAVCTRRMATAHARMRLCGDELSFSGPSRLVESWLHEQQGRLSALASCIARRSPRSTEEVLNDVTANRYLSASEAVDYGLIDEIVAPDARVLPFRAGPGRPTVGFRPTEP